MSKRENLILLADDLIRDKGYNAFSFSDISKIIKIKTSSIHYYFPQKSDLGVAVLDFHYKNLLQIIKDFQDKSPIEKLDKFFSIYSQIKSENKICIVGSLSTDFNTLESNIQNKLKEFSSLVIEWVTDFLEEGRNNHIFQFAEDSKVKAQLIITSMISIVHLSRLTSNSDFETITNTIKQNLIIK